MSRRSCSFLCIVAAIAIPASCALAIGFRLGQTKDDLGLEYDVSICDHDTGRVTVQFSLEDEGRLRPITTIDLHICSEELQQTEQSRSKNQVAHTT